MRHKFLFKILIVIVCVGSVFVARVLKPNSEELLKKRVAERSLGDPKAPIQVVEYFDYQCPPCSTVRAVLDDWMIKHPGKIYLQLRYYPLAAHSHALKAALYAECAARQEGKFFKFHNLLFDHQTEWAREAYPQLKFLIYAEKAELALSRFDVCVKDPEIEKFVNEERAKADSLGVKITPSFFVNGKMVVGVKALLEELDAVVNQKPATS